MSFENPTRTKKRKGEPCPFCGGDATRVKATRRRWLGRRHTYRRHECAKCGKRFSTLTVGLAAFRRIVEAAVAEALRERERSL